MYIRCIKTKIEGDDSSPYFSINDEFVVYGLLFSGRGLLCLLDNGKKWGPTWFPMELFKIIDGKFPYDWHLNYVTETFSIFSYQLLAFDADHYNNVIEHEKADLEIFYTEKQKIDEWHKKSMNFIPLFEEKLSKVLLNDTTTLIRKFTITNIEFTGGNAFTLHTSQGIYTGTYTASNEYYKYLRVDLTQVLELDYGIVLFFTEELSVTLYI